MIIGAMNSPKNSLVGEINLFGEMGFDYFELTVEAPAATPEKILKDRKVILDALHSYNFGVLSHYPWYFSVAHPYENVQKSINEEFGRAFAAAASLGAKKATIHTEWMPPGIQERPVMVAKTIENVKKLHKSASELGISMTFDVGHAAKHDGEGVDNYLQEFRKRIRHVHLHDNNKKEDQHLPLGAGRIDMAHVVKELKSFYDGTITLEVHSEDRHYLKASRDKLEILWYGKEHHERNKEYLFPEKK